MSVQGAFPRPDDAKGWAWGLSGARPEHIWERFSPAYEAQARDVLNALSALGFTACLDFAGSQDGEAALGLRADGRLALLVHLEDPTEARKIEKARNGNSLRTFLEAML